MRLEISRYSNVYTVHSTIFHVLINKNAHRKVWEMAFFGTQLLAGVMNVPVAFSKSVARGMLVSLLKKIWSLFP